MNAMDVALICKALGDANRLEIVQMLDGWRKSARWFLNFGNDLKIPSQLYPMMNFPEIL